MIDIKLLQIMRYRDEYYRLYPDLPESALDVKTKCILDDFGKYFEKFPKHSEVDVQVFMPAFKRWHPQLTVDQFNAYVGMMRLCMQDVDDDTKEGVLADMHELALGTHIVNALAQFEAGELRVPLGDVISDHVDRYKTKLGMKLTSWIDTPIEELLEDEVDDRGIHWRLNCLNECMRPLRPGDFGLAAGRPDKGKTTFIASEVTHFASQIPEDKNILWLNNEGPGRRIIPRLYQSALGISMSEMVQRSNAGTLTRDYEEVVGRKDRIRVVDIHGMHVGQVDRIIEKHNAAIVIFDMIDHIKGFQGEARTDLQLEEMYKWARERAVKHDTINIATSQISNEGDGLQFPTLGMLKDSKTGKQGAVDFQIMIGASNDANLQGMRYIGLPKNKLRRENAQGDPKATVKFRPDVVRYEDLELGA